MYIKDTPLTLSHTPRRYAFKMLYVKPNWKKLTNIYYYSSRVQANQILTKATHIQ